MERYEAIIYDLDGTLVRLDVDWGAVRREAKLKLEARDVDVGDGSLWDMIELGRESGLYPVVEDTIATHERDGARTSEKLRAAHALPHDIPTGVCSLNCEAACRIALEMHGLDGYVDAIVGRNTVATEKPDPEPVLEAVRSLSANPGETLFVGDSERDAEAAARAGVEFNYVAEW